MPSIRAKAEFCFRWLSSIEAVDKLRTSAERRQFLLNLICFAACIEGLFFFAAFAYVYFLRSKGLLNGLAAGTNWVFHDESGHMDFAFAVVDIVRHEEPELFDDELEAEVTAMMVDAVEAEACLPPTSWPGECPACRWPTPGLTWSTLPTSGWPASACLSALARVTHFPSCSSKTSRRWLTFRKNSVCLPGRRERRRQLRRGVIRAIMTVKASNPGFLALVPVGSGRMELRRRRFYA